ncbi:MAG: carbohydrate kinase family protein [Gemmatimonadota bacterium]
MRSSGARLVGVVGSFVRDTVIPAPGADPLEEGWGGIAYSLEGFHAALPEGCRIRPIVKVGEDLAEEALAYLRGMECIEPGGRVMVVPGPNYRVTLRYLDREEREERLFPGPSPWDWGELAPRVTGCEALYVNFITGLEMDLATATLLRSHFSGPMHADLHSLFLAVEEDGQRTPRPLDRWEAWIQAFDTVQVNEREFALLAGDWHRSKEAVQKLLGGGTRLVAVTRGARGATVFSETEEWHAPAVPGDPSGRPTGCGDVWGAAFCARLLAKDSVEEAMRVANGLASRRMGHSGAEGLAAHLAAAGPLRPAENETP